MNKQMPTIEKYMTAIPRTVGLSLSIAKAWDMMKEFQIRHLPVVRAGQLCGIISDRDIKLAASIQGGSELKCEDVMTPDPYAVRTAAELDTVIRDMALRKIGSAIVTQKDGRVIGIFTDNDALRALDNVLCENYTRTADLADPFYVTEVA